MNRIVVLAAALTLSIVTVARAEEPAKPAPSKAALATAGTLARKVLTPEGYKEKLDRMVKAIHDAQPIAKQALLTDAFWTKFRVGLEDRMPYEEMITDQSASFAGAYTADELKRLLAFYESPLGKKALKVMPEVMADATARAEAHMHDRLPGLLQELMKDEPKSKTYSEQSKP